MVTRRLAATLVDASRQPLLRYAPLCGGPWALSTYDACDLRCSYCVTYAQGPSTPRCEPEQVAQLLRHELEHVPLGATIGVGALVDAYPHAEAEVGITRLAVAELVAQGRRMVIVTKGLTITRDIELLQSADVTVAVSLCSLDDAELQKIEPHVAGSAERIAVANRLAAAGIDTQLNVQPWIPGITDADALVAAVDPGVRVSFGPLNVQVPSVSTSRLGRGFTQAEVNAAYVAEAERVGNRPGVVWTMPIWVEPPAGDGWDLSPDRTNLETARRIVTGMNDNSFALAMLGVLSAHVIGHDLSGISLDGRDRASGYFGDLLGAAKLALDDPRFEVLSVQTVASPPDADLAAIRSQGDGSSIGELVETNLVVHGSFVRPFATVPPTGREVELAMRITYRCDDDGMVVEMWQEPDLTSV